MAITVNWITKVVFIPENEATISTVISASSPTIYEYDLDALRLELKAIEASEEGMPFDDIHFHTAPFTIGNVQLARVVGIINGYKIEFEDGQYQVNYTGANTDFSEATNRIINQVSVTPQNSAGLITTASTIELISAAVWESLKIDHVSPASMGSALNVIAYGNKVWVDPLNLTGNAAAGQVPGVNGLHSKPCLSLADAVVVAAAFEFYRYGIISDTALTFDMPNTKFEGIHSPELDTAGYDVSGAEFDSLILTGQNNGQVTVTDCVLDGNTDMCGLYVRCGLVSVSSLDAGKTVLDSCRSEIAGLGTPTLDFGGHPSSSLSLRSYSGGIELINMTQATSAVSLDLDSGQIILGATNTDGTIVCRGVGVLFDTTTGSTVNSDGLINSPVIAEAVLKAGAYMKRDNITYDGNGFPISGRERVFPTKALADAATYGGVGEGETSTYTITASPDGTFPTAPRTFDRIQDV